MTTIANDYDSPEGPDSNFISTRVDSEKLQHIISENELKALLAYEARIMADKSYTWARVEAEIGYDNSTVSRVFRGKYGASYKNIIRNIQAFLSQMESEVRDSSFVQTSLTEKIWRGLQFALDNRTGALIIGPARFGKTVTAKAFADYKEHAGQVTYLQASPSASLGTFQRHLCRALGIPHKLNRDEMTERIVRALGGSRRDNVRQLTRMLIVDEAHRLITTKSSGPIEYLRWLTDETGCAFGLLATVQLEDNLLAGSYIYDQMIGRIDAPIKLAASISRKNWLPIADQYIAGLSIATMSELDQVVESPGRLGALIAVMKLAANVATKAGRKTIAEEDVIASINWRKNNLNERFINPKKGK